MEQLSAHLLYFFINNTVLLGAQSVVVGSGVLGVYAGISRKVK